MMDGALISVETSPSYFLDVRVVREAPRPDERAGLTGRAALGVAAAFGVAGFGGLTDLPTDFLGVEERFVATTLVVSTFLVTTVFLGAAGAFLGAAALTSLGAAAAFFFGGAAAFRLRVERTGDSSSSTELFSSCRAPPGTLKAAEALEANFSLPISDLDAIKRKHNEHILQISHAQTYGEENNQQCRCDCGQIIYILRTIFPRGHICPVG